MDKAQRLRSFIEANEIEKVDKFDSEDHLKATIGDATQVFFIYDSPNIQNLNTPNALLFGKPIENVFYDVYSYFKQTDSDAISNDEIARFQNISYFSRYTQSHVLILKSSLRYLVAGINALSYVVSESLTYFNPWASVRYIFTSESTANKTIISSYLKKTGIVNHAYSLSRLNDLFSTNLDDPEFDPSIPTYVEPGMNKRLVRKDLKFFIESLSRNYSLNGNSERLYLDSPDLKTSISEFNFSFDLPSKQEDLDEPVLYITPPDSIASFRKTSLYKDNENDFTTSRVGNLGLCAYKPVKGSSYSEFWMLNGKILDSLSLIETVDAFMSRPEPFITYFSSVSYFNTPAVKEVSDLESSSNSELLKFYNNGSTNTVAYIFSIFSQRRFVEAFEALPKLIKSGLDPRVIADVFYSYMRSSLLSDFKKVFDVYNASLGGSVDESSIKETSFGKVYYSNLTPVQKVKLREYINKGEVNDDVLNNQPMAAWLLLSCGYSLNRIRTKKSKIFDSLKFRSKPPKWIFSRLLENPEAPDTKTLDRKKYLFKLLKESWGSKHTVLWLLEQDDKIFSDLDQSTLIKLLSYWNTVEQASKNAKRNYVYGFYPPSHGVGHIPEDLNLDRIYSLYTDWLVSGQGELGPKQLIIDKKQKDKEFKAFLLTFREFVNNFFSSMPLSLRPVRKALSNEYIFSSGKTSNLYSHFNDLFINMAYLYGVLTGESPMDSWANFTSFIWQTNRWVLDAKIHHQRQLELRNNATTHDFRVIHDTESFIRELIKETGAWYEWTTYRYNRTGVQNYDYRNPILDTSDSVNSHFALDNEANGFNSTAYTAVRDIFYLFVSRCHGIAKSGAINKKDQQSNVYKSIGFDFISRNGFTAYHISNQYDLRQEGKSMNHCVGSYNNSCSNGSNVIFHISPDDLKASEKKAISTLQWRRAKPNPKNLFTGHDYTVGQNYSYNNSSTTDENKAFAAWLHKKYHSVINSGSYAFFESLMSFFDLIAKNAGLPGKASLGPQAKKKESKYVDEEDSKKLVDLHASRLSSKLKKNKKPEPIIRMEIT